MRTARFWTSINGGWVKLSLRPDRNGACASHTVFKQTDEGSEITAVDFFHQGDRVERHMIWRGVDCDGHTGSFAVQHCPLSQLYAQPNEYSPIGVSPAWQTEAREQFDDRAEAMGY